MPDKHAPATRRGGCKLKSPLDEGSASLQDRKGEKSGWIGGWLGGFVWVAILSIVLLFQGRVLAGIVGLVLFDAAAVLILAAAPWRHPDTPYWKLMMPVYVVFFAAIAWMMWSYGGPASLGLSPWSIFLVLPILIPFATAGRRRWNDSDT